MSNKVFLFSFCLFARVRLSCLDFCPVFIYFARLYQVFVYLLDHYHPRNECVSSPSMSDNHLLFLFICSPVFIYLFSRLYLFVLSCWFICQTITPEVSVNASSTPPCQITISCSYLFVLLFLFICSPVLIYLSDYHPRSECECLLHPSLSDNYLLFLFICSPVFIYLFSYVGLFVRPSPQK